MTTIPKLPNDILFNIFKENKINKQNEIYKKRHNLMIKHLQEYCEEYGDDINTDDMNNIRCDCRFCEYTDSWNNSLGKCVENYHGEETLDHFLDNHF